MQKQNSVTRETCSTIELHITGLQKLFLGATFTVFLSVMGWIGINVVENKASVTAVAAQMASVAKSIENMQQMAFNYPFVYTTEEDSSAKFEDLDTKINANILRLTSVENEQLAYKIRLNYIEEYSSTHKEDHKKFYPIN